MANNNPKARKAPGANTKTRIPSAGENFIPKKDKLPKNSRTILNNVKDKVKPNPIPNPSIAELKIVFFEANASALPKTIQLTTIKGINNPNCTCKSGRYACINKSTTVTKEAMITIKEGIRTVSGIRFLRQAITIFDKISTNVVAKPIPNPLNAEVVTPKVGHIPNKSTNVGFSFNIPLVNIFLLFIIFSSYH